MTDMHRYADLRNFERWEEEWGSRGAFTGTQSFISPAFGPENMFRNVVEDIKRQLGAKIYGWSLLSRWGRDDV